MHACTTLVVILVFALFVSASARVSQDVTAASRTPRDVTFCELASNPAAFDRAHVRLTAFVNFTFEDFVVWDPTCRWTKAGSGLWVTYGGKVNSGAVYCCPGEPDRRTHPVPEPVVEDRTLKEFRSLLINARDTVARATLVGTVLVAMEGRDADPSRLSGYGHLGCCSLFVIERVESFDPHTRKDLDYSSLFSGLNLGRVPPCAGYGGVENDVTNANGDALGPPFDGGEPFIREQAAADAGERPWLFTDPERVAIEAAREVHGAAVTSLKRVKSTQAQQVFEWPHDQRVTTVVVARPYWLSLYAKSFRVAWVATAVNTSFCK